MKLHVSTWKDELGMIHIKPNERSDHGIKILGEYLIMKYLEGTITEDDKKEFANAVNAHKIKTKWWYCFTRLGTWSQTPWNKKDPSSHDNDTVIRSVSYLLDLDFHKEGKIFGKFFHPRDIFYYMWLKGGWKRTLSYVGLWITHLAQVSTCKDVYKKRKHGTFVDTDGKLLTFSRCYCTEHESSLISHSLKKCREALGKHTLILDYESNQYVDVSRFHLCFKHYYKMEDHPCREKSQELHEKSLI